MRHSPDLRSAAAGGSLSNHWGVSHGSHPIPPAIRDLGASQRIPKRPGSQILIGYRPELRCTWASRAAASEFGVQCRWRVPEFEQAHHVIAVFERLETRWTRCRVRFVTEPQSDPIDAEC